MFVRNENKLNINHLKLKDDELKKKKVFFSSKDISLLKKEFNLLFSMPSFNVSSGFCILKKNLFITYKCTNLPTATIKKINLLETSCEIREYISKQIKFLNYILFKLLKIFK